MAHDIEILTHVVVGMLAIACICSTAFPILYLFAPWYKTRLGRALMIQGWAFAVALDFTLVFYFWQPTSLFVVLWMNAVVFTLIAGATAYLTWKMLKHNLYIPMIKKRDKKENDDVGTDTRGDVRAEAPGLDAASH